MINEFIMLALSMVGLNARIVTHFEGKLLIRAVIFIDCVSFHKWEVSAVSCLNIHKQVNLVRTWHRPNILDGCNI